MEININRKNLIKIRETNNGFIYGLEIEGTAYGNVLNASPTANCQVSSIMSMNVLLSIDEKLKNTENKITCVDVLKELIPGYCKNLILIDINRSLEIKLEKIILSDFVVFKNKYTSSNGNLMTIYMVKKTFINKL
jgi:hypothetical protein